MMPTTTADGAKRAAIPARGRVRWFLALPRQLLLALIVTAVISLIVFGVSEAYVSRVATLRTEAQGLRQRASYAGDIREALLAAEASQRGFLLTGDQRYLQPFKDAAARAEKACVGLKAASPSGTPWESRSGTIVELANRKLDEMRVTLGKAEQGRHDAALELVRSGIGTQTMDELLELNIAFETEQLDLLRMRQLGLDDALQGQRIGVGVVVLLNLACLAVLAHLMIRQFMLRDQHRRDLQDVADGLETIVAERTEQLEALSTHLQTSSEREKAQLARDLHDELGGILTSAKIDIAWVEGHSKASDPELVPRLQRLSSVLDEAVDMKRRVVESLRPSLLDHLGLGAALNWYVTDTCRKAGLECELTNLPDDTRVPPEMAIAIYRLVQEGLTNTLRYAKASKVTIVIGRQRDGIRINVADDGVGIRNFEPKHLSHGLAGMRHRARAMGGTFRIDSGPGLGTRFEAYFPLPAAEAETEAEVVR